MLDKCRIIPNALTSTSKRYFDTIRLLTKLEKEGALISQGVKTEKGYIKMYYAATENEKERKEFFDKVKSGEIKSYTMKEFENLR